MNRKKFFVIGMIMLCILSGCGDSGGDAEEAPKENVSNSAENRTYSQESGAEQEKPVEGAAEPKDSLALNDDERQFFTEFIQERENYGFLLSDYAVPEDVNLDEVLYSGAGFGENLPEEDIPLYLEAAQQEFVETDCLKFTRQGIEDFLLRKLGIGMEDLNIPFGWIYLPETDSYYHEAGDTNYVRFSCVGGSRIGDTYTLHFTPESDWELWNEDCETVIVKTEDGYRFVSNRTLAE